MNKGETPSCGLSRATAISAPRVAAAVRLGLVTASQTAERERAAIGEGLVAPRSCSLAWLGGWYKGSRADSRGNLTPASPDAGSDSRGSGASADEHPLPPTRYLEHPGYCGITLVPRFPPGQTLFSPPSFSSITSFSGLTRWVDARAISSLLFNLVILSFLLLASRCGRSISMKRGYGIILEAD